MSNASFCAPPNSDTNRTTDTEANTMNVKKITARVHQCMIPALAQLCSRTDLQVVSYSCNCFYCLEYDSNETICLLSQNGFILE